MRLNDTSVSQPPGSGDGFTDRLKAAFAASAMPRDFGRILFELGQRLIETYAENFEPEFARSKAEAIANNFAKAMPDAWHEHSGFRADARGYFLHAARLADRVAVAEAG